MRPRGLTTSASPKPVRELFALVREEGANLAQCSLAHDRQEGLVTDAAASCCLMAANTQWVALSMTANTGRRLCLHLGSCFRTSQASGSGTARSPHPTRYQSMSFLVRFSLLSCSLCAALLNSSPALPTMHSPTVHTMHWENIPTNILDKQKAVFAHLNIPLQQHLADKTPHGSWMVKILEQAHSDDIVVICDIDAFPLTRTAYEDAVAHAQAGKLYGLAQFSNHKPGNQIYAGPMFMAFRKRLWESLGAPDLRSSKLYDAAEIMSALARQHHIELVMVPPTTCLMPKWALGHEGVFGIGTFYGQNQFFHLFESRNPAYEAILDAVADDVTQCHPLDFAGYLALCQQLQGTSKPAKKKWWKWL